MYRYKELPSAPSLEFLKKEAKDLRRDHRSGDSEALQFIRIHHPRLTAERTIASVAASDFSTQDAQLVIARAYQFDSWPQLVAELDWVPVRHSLDHAISEDDVAAVEEILDEHPQLLAKPVRNHNNGPPLTHAAGHGALSVVKSLLRRDPEDVERAFHRATLYGYEDIIDFLLAQHPSRLQEALRLALHNPLESLNVEAVKFLLERGSDPNAPWSNGVLPMDKAIGTLSEDRITIIRSLIEAGAHYRDLSRDGHPSGRH